jgi:hypothetical protein
MNRQGRLDMNHGLSDQVRALAKAKYVHPAMLAGQRQFSIPVKELLHALESDGFPGRNTPQVCSALQTSKFLRENGLEIEGIDGPPSKMSTTVVVRYRVANPGIQDGTNRAELENQQAGISEETPEQWAHRLTERISGLLKEELAEYGGGEAFLRWVRPEDEDAA